MFRVTIVSLLSFFLFLSSANATNISGCTQNIPSSSSQGGGESENQQFTEQIKSKMNSDSGQNAPLVLAFCAAQLPIVGPSVVLGECACKEAVKQCTFDVKEMVVKGPSSCTAFAPWNL